MTKPKAIIFSIIMLTIIFGMSYKTLRKENARWEEVKALYYAGEITNTIQANDFLEKNISLITHTLHTCQDQECLSLLLLESQIKDLNKIYREYSCLEAEAHLKIFQELLKEKIHNALDFPPVEREALAKTSPNYLQELIPAVSNITKACPISEEE